jgi:zinc protease
MAQWSFEQVVYANHPYRRPEDGYPNTLQAITPDDLQVFHRQFYGPRGLVLVVVGAVDPALAVEKVDRALGDWQNPGQPFPPELPDLTPVAEVVTRRAEIPGMSQADLVMGVAGPPRRSPHFIAANLGNSILGQFGMMGRIGEVVREKAGLAYYAHSSLSGGLGPAPWDISAGADPQDIEQIIDLIRQEIRRFVNEPVIDQELVDVQDQFINSLPLSLESNHGIAGALINLERHHLGLDYYRQYANMIRGVTSEDVLAAARHYLDPDRLGIGIAGTFDQ